MEDISAADIIRRVRVENPWWEGDVPHRELKPRAYLALFLPLVKEISVRRAVVLMGPRRVGKTVLIHHAIQKLVNDGVPQKLICYFSVDHPIYNGLSLEKLLDYYSQASGVDYKTEKIYVFFDEIQYLRKWEVHLKAVVDTYTNIKGGWPGLSRLSIAHSSEGAPLKLRLGGVFGLRALSSLTHPRPSLFSQRWVADTSHLVTHVLDRPHHLANHSN